MARLMPRLAPVLSATLPASSATARCRPARVQRERPFALAT
jgi:hypothetical protein